MRMTNNGCIWTLRGLLPVAQELQADGLRAAGRRRAQPVLPAAGNLLLQLLLTLTGGHSNLTTPEQATNALNHASILTSQISDNSAQLGRSE
jgi:hypothetical protein